MGKGRAFWYFFQFSCLLSPQALGSWEADPRLGRRERGLLKMEAAGLLHPQPGFGVGVDVGRSWVKGPS